MKDLKPSDPNTGHFEVRNNIESIISMIQSLSLEYEIREKVNQRNISELLFQVQFLYLSTAKSEKPETLINLESKINKNSPPENSDDSESMEDPKVPKFIERYRSIIKNMNSYTENFNRGLIQGSPASLIINIKEHTRLIKTKLSKQKQTLEGTENTFPGPDLKFNDSLRAKPTKTETSESQKLKDIQDEVKTPMKQLEASIKLTESRSKILHNKEESTAVKQSSVEEDSFDDKEYEKFVNSMNSNSKTKAFMNHKCASIQNESSTPAISIKKPKNTNTQPGIEDFDNTRNRSTTLYQPETSSSDFPPIKTTNTKLLQPSKEPFFYMQEIANFLVLSKANAFHAKDIGEIYFGELEEFKTSKDSLTTEINGKIIIINDLQDIFGFFSSCNMCIAVTTSKVFVVSPPHGKKAIYKSDDTGFVHFLWDLKSPIIDATGHIFDNSESNTEYDAQIRAILLSENSSESKDSFDTEYNSELGIDDKSDNKTEPVLKDCIILLHKNYMCTLLKFKLNINVNEVFSFSTTHAQQNPFKVLMHPYAIEDDVNIYKAIFIYPGLVRNINCENSFEDIAFREVFSSYIKDANGSITCACMTSYKLALGFDSGKAFIFDIFAKVKFLFNINFENPIRDLLIDPYDKAVCADQTTGMFACPFVGTGETSKQTPIQIITFTQTGLPFVPLRYDPNKSIYLFMNRINKIFYRFKLKESL